MDFWPFCFNRGTWYYDYEKRKNASFEARKMGTFMVFDFVERTICFNNMKSFMFQKLVS